MHNKIKFFCKLLFTSEVGCPIFGDLFRVDAYGDFSHNNVTIDVYNLKHNNSRVKNKKSFTLIVDWNSPHDNVFVMML